MNSRILLVAICAAALSLSLSVPLPSAWSADGTVTKRVIRVESAGENLLHGDAWGPWREGFERRSGEWVCDNGSDAQVQRGASQSVVLNQRTPRADYCVCVQPVRGSLRFAGQQLLVVSRSDLHGRLASVGAACAL